MRGGASGGRGQPAPPRPRPAEGPSVYPARTLNSSSVTVGGRPPTKMRRKYSDSSTRFRLSGGASARDSAGLASTFAHAQGGRRGRARRTGPRRGPTRRRKKGPCAAQRPPPSESTRLSAVHGVGHPDHFLGHVRFLVDHESKAPRPAGQPIVAHKCLLHLSELGEVRPARPAPWGGGSPCLGNTARSRVPAPRQAMSGGPRADIETLDTLEPPRTALTPPRGPWIARNAAHLSAASSVAQLRPPMNILPSLLILTYPAHDAREIRYANGPRRLPAIEVSDQGLRGLAPPQSREAPALLQHDDSRKDSSRVRCARRPSFRARGRPTTRPEACPAQRWRRDNLSGIFSRSCAGSGAGKAGARRKARLTGGQDVRHPPPALVPAHMRASEPPRVTLRPSARPEAGGWECLRDKPSISASSLLAEVSRDKGGSH